jgi:hypothetical protein
MQKAELAQEIEKLRSLMVTRYHKYIVTFRVTQKPGQLKTLQKKINKQ